MKHMAVVMCLLSDCNDYSREMTDCLVSNDLNEEADTQYLLTINNGSMKEIMSASCRKLSAGLWRISAWREMKLVAKIGNGIWKWRNGVMKEWNQSGVNMKAGNIDNIWIGIESWKANEIS